MTPNGVLVGSGTDPTTLQVSAGGDASNKPVTTGEKARTEPPSLPETLSLKTVSNIDKIKDVSDVTIFC